MVRKAALKDAEAVFALIEAFAAKGDMLHRSVVEICSSIRDFFVFYDGSGNGLIRGVCALNVGFNGLGEIRSLAVDEGSMGRGVGSALVEGALAEAGELGLKKVFALTYSPAFFERFGFKLIERETLPQKIWGECADCRKFHDCDESAVMLELEA